MHKWVFELDNVKTTAESGLNVKNESQLPYFIESRKDHKFLSTDIEWTVEAFIKHYTGKSNNIITFAKDYGLNSLGKFTYRIKSDYSLQDKIRSYLKSHPSANFEDVWYEIRDCLGMRTIIESSDLTKHPNVKDLIDKGDMIGAKRKAAEIQAEPLVNEFKNIIDKNVSGNKNLQTIRITNYVSDEGIPYLSEAQLIEIRDYAISKGIQLDIYEKIMPDDPKYNEIKDSDYKSTTRSQVSGYTALQVNFITKDGDIIEWQYRGDKVNSFAEAEHIPYDLRTGKDIIGSHKELSGLYEQVRNIIAKMDNDIYNQYCKYLTAHYEHTIAITEDGYLILTTL